MCRKTANLLYGSLHVWKDFDTKVNGGMRKHREGTTESLRVPNSLKVESVSPSFQYVLGKSPA